MPRKNTPKPAKRAKLSGIERFFKDPQQDLAEQTSTLASHVPSDSGNSIPSTPLTPTINQRQSNMIHAVSNSSTSLAEFVESDEVESQEISCAAISGPSMANEQGSFSKESISSNFLKSSRYSPDTVSASSSLTAKPNNILNLDTPNQPKVSVILLRSYQREHFIFNQSGMKITNRFIMTLI